MAKKKLSDAGKLLSSICQFIFICLCGKGQVYIDPAILMLLFKRLYITVCKYIPVS